MMTTIRQMSSGSGEDGVSARVPDHFIAVGEGLHRGLDRKLGYCGEDRFVLFYYEPRGEEVVWVDGRRYGFGLGGWCVFIDQIIPLATRHGVDVSGSHPRGACGMHVLVLDRLTGLAHFAPRLSAERFVASQGDLSAA